MFGLGAESAILTSAWFLLLLKWLIVGVFAMYVAFAFIVTRQIHIMRKTLITSFTPVLRVIGYAHLAVSLALFVFFILFL